ncbi:HsdM family class I SAM-dependent methyltransferase [Spirosoma montaniterrae]|uniref:site-specific DNA-methyltransferase (adenine-specific) n=1 Tax=Spirosoma montaniterrae TaxID=1178516 RepID=A0A1P9X1R4_9BACT|nr:class I SAM-dependent DNA methyltransferase [Spirosoma montaniterrae]AQG81569.1 DNA methyltransferase [Spirosoma montaniterrae]
MAHNLSGIIKSIRDTMREDKGVNGDAQRIEQLGWMLFLKIFDDKDQEMELLDDAYVSPIPAEYQWRNWAANAEGITGDALLEFIDRGLFPTLRQLPTTSVGGAANPRALLVSEVFEGNNNYMKSGTNLRKVCNKLNEIDFNVATERHLFGDLYENILRELQSAGDSGEFYTPRAVTQFMADIIAPRLGEVVYDPACGTGGFLTAVIEHLKPQANTVADRQLIQANVRGTEYKPLPYVLALTNLILHDVEVPNIRYDDSLAREYTSIRDRDRVDVILANPPFGGTVANGNEGNFPANFRTRESADLFLVLIVNLLKQGGRAALVLPDGSLTGEGVKQRVREKLLTDCNLHTIVRLPQSVFAPYATVSTNLLFFEKKQSVNLPSGAGPLFETEPNHAYATREIWYYEHQLPEGQKAYSKTKPIRLDEFDKLKAWWTKREENEQAWRVPIEQLVARNFDLDIKNPHRKTEETPAETAELIALLSQSMQRSLKLLAGLKEAVEA